jgi:hypothetical protein
MNFPSNPLFTRDFQLPRLSDDIFEFYSQSVPTPTHDHCYKDAEYGKPFYHHAHLPPSPEGLRLDPWAIVKWSQPEFNSKKQAPKSCICGKFFLLYKEYVI